MARKGDARMIEMSTGTYAIAAPDLELYNPITLLPASGAPFATLQEASGPVLGLAAVLNGEALAVGCCMTRVRGFLSRIPALPGTNGWGKLVP